MIKTKYYAAHRNETIERQKKYNLVHKKEKQEYDRKYNIIRKDYKKEYRFKLKKTVLDFYSYKNGTIKCVLCGESDLRCLSLDHINGNGNQHRKQIGRGGGTNFYVWIIKNDFPGGYRTLCMNCQFKLKNKAGWLGE